MPRFVSALVVVLASLALLPFACIYKARHTQSPLPRIHLIQGMDNQPRLKTQQVNPFFADTREERRPVPDKPHIPDDHFILLTIDGGPA